MKNKKPTLLFLSHRIPYPPNKGDKIRSWHLLKYLAKSYRIFLGTFVDDEADWQYLERIQSVCEGTYFVRLDSKRARIKSLSGFFKGDPLTLPYYSNRELASWVEQVVHAKGIKKAVVYSSAMAQYVLDDMLPLEQKIIDFVDVDSDKWEQYAKNKPWPLSYLYQREAKKLLSFDRKVACKFDYNFFVSTHEAELFKQLAPEVADKVGSYNNGVDSNYFCPKEVGGNPYIPGVLPIVFTGAMDYWPNVDAVIYFVKSIFPLVVEKYPAAEFFIVGSNPSEQVKDLAKVQGVTVTGRVEDIRPYVKFASVAVAPMRIARGIQNKVLEAMAMKKTVVTSPQGLEGIQAIDGKEILIAQTPEHFADKVNHVLTENENTDKINLPELLSFGEAARKRILSDFNWDRNLTLLDTWLEENSSRQVDRLHLVKVAP